MSQADEERVGPPSRVLVVDPDEALRIVLEDAVRDLDHEVVAGASPRDAIAALDGSPFDVVILGIEDPPADAVRLARWIKSKRPGIDLIVITDPSAVSVAEAKRLGAFDILTRPLLDPGLVTASIDRVLEKRGLESELRQAREGSLLSEVGQVIGSSLDIGQVYERFADRVRRLIPSDRVAIGVTDFDRNITTTIHASGVDVPEVRPGKVTANPPEPFVRDTHRAGIIQMSDPERPEDDLPNLTAARRAGLRSFLTLPLIYQNRTVGSLGLRSLEEDAYTQQHLELAERMAPLIAPAVANAQLYSDLTETQHQLQQAHSELEHRVEHRTAELAASEIKQRHLTQENQVMVGLGRIMSSSLDIEEIYDVFVERIIKLVRVLSEAGHTVESASDGQSALEMVQAGKFDCAIVDINMPGMDGRELYQRLGAMDPPLARNVIFNTGDTVRKEVTDFLRETGNPVLRKPFDASQLWTHLWEVVAR